MNDGTHEVGITRVDAAGEREERDLVVAEEPLEIRVGERALSVTMRTPGDDFDLAAGFLITEGVLHDAGDIESIRHWGSPNVVRASLRDGVTIDWQRLQRNFYATSSCGVCGKSSIDALRVHARAIERVPELARDVVSSLPDRLRETQRTFATTGGIHAAALFTADGALVVSREDVGRHNAVDKVIGAQLRAGAPLHELVLVVSGRVSFEVVQKAAVAGVPVIAAVGAPSSLAVELAREFGQRLIGFVRDGRYNVYS